MKTARTIVVLLAAILLGFATSPPAKADVDVSFGFFYSNLEPHGSWLVSAEYGRVWQPAVYRPGWNPYYDGHWEYSDCGWVWVSDYAWGAVPYHYGTWVLDPRFGWVWVPGTTWAPSWVVFRTGPDYIGWAPVPPGFSVGASFTLGDDPNLFVFVGAGDFLAPRIATRVVPVERTRTVIRSTTIVNNFTVDDDVVVNRGPDVRLVERATGKKVREAPIEQVRNVAPTGRVTRSDLRVRDQGALRAARPVPKDEPVPEMRQREPRGRTSPRLDATRENRLQQQGRAERDGFAQQKPRVEARSGAARETQTLERERTRAQDKAAAQRQERDARRAKAAAEKKAAEEKKKGGGKKDNG